MFAGIFSAKWEEQLPQDTVGEVDLALVVVLPPFGRLPGKGGYSLVRLPCLQ